MKFFVPLALLAAVGVSAATTVSTAASASSTACDADYIVTQCLETEEKKPALCGSTDYGCLCAAYQSIATCYNNCPNDPRGASAQNQVTVNCANASIYSTTSKKSTKTAAAASGASETSTAAAADASATESSATAIQSSSPSATGNAAGDLARNTGGVLLAVAGVVAALL
ncbi:hypothetical protein BKA56DRAFT_613264 [Ilyonectria sp. MPI-CAGE-AT-0026]|nr:hypothetical protein BKA56DRAFT_613264 [Ilyonectria sp. MPI-CAGE-AT-0026]